MIACRVFDRSRGTAPAGAAALTLMLFAAACAGPEQADGPDLPPDMPGNPPRDARTLIEFVDQAARLVERRGPGALEPFTATDGPWWDPDVHLFVLTAAGEALFYASAPHVVGRDVTTLMDVDGRPFGHWQLEAARQPDGRSWAFYTWPRPHEIGPAWTATYARSAEARGQRYVVGAGIFDLSVDEVLLNELGRHAAADLARDPAAALQRIDDDTGRYAYRGVRVAVVDDAGRHRAGRRIDDRVAAGIGDWLRETDDAEASISVIDGGTWPSQRPGIGAVHRVTVENETYAVFAVRG